MIETQVSKGIISTYFDKLERNLNLDVAIVGGGPSGIVAAYYLAKAGLEGSTVRPQALSRRWHVGWRYDVQSDCHSGRGNAHHQGLRHQL